MFQHSTKILFLAGSELGWKLHQGTVKRLIQLSGTYPSKENFIEGLQVTAD